MYGIASLKQIKNLNDKKKEDAASSRQYGVMGSWGHVRQYGVMGSWGHVGQYGVMGSCKAVWGHVRQYGVM